MVPLVVINFSLVCGRKYIKHSSNETAVIVFAFFVGRISGDTIEETRFVLGGHHVVNLVLPGNYGRKDREVADVQYRALCGYLRGTCVADHDIGVERSYGER